MIPLRPSRVQRHRHLPLNDRRSNRNPTFNASDDLHIAIVLDQGRSPILANPKDTLILSNCPVGEVAELIDDLNVSDRQSTAFGNAYAIVDKAALHFMRRATVPIPVDGHRQVLDIDCAQCRRPSRVRQIANYGHTAWHITQQRFRLSRLQFAECPNQARDTG
jgi:hypothetical protein